LQTCVRSEARSLIKKQASKSLEDKGKQRAEVHKTAGSANTANMVMGTKPSSSGRRAVLEQVRKCPIPISRHPAFTQCA
jgi:hypothetical protein